MKHRNRENPVGKTLLQKEIAEKTSEGLQKPPTGGMFQKIGTKINHEETSFKNEEVKKFVKKKLLIYRTCSEIEPNQVENTIICIKSGCKQRQTAKLKNTNGIKHQSLKS